METTNQPEYTQDAPTRNPHPPIRGRTRPAPPRQTFKPSSLNPSSKTAEDSKVEKEDDKKGQRQARPQIKKPAMSGNPFGGGPDISEQPIQPSQIQDSTETPPQQSQTSIISGPKLPNASDSQVTQEQPQISVPKPTLPSQEVGNSQSYEEKTINEGNKDETQKPISQEKKDESDSKKVDSQKSQVPKEKTKSLPPASKQKPPREEKKGGFFSMITGYLGILNLRKQAFVGKPASAMFYDEKKGRYIIPGEEESEDDEPPPPPPGLKRAVPQENTQPEKTDNVSGVNALTSIGFAGALANKGRGRGRGRGGITRPLENFPQTGVKSGENLDGIEKRQDELKQEKQVLRDTELLYQTAIEHTEPNLEMSNTLDQSDMLNLSAAKPDPGFQLNLYDNSREAMWVQKYQKMSQKINAYKAKIHKYQDEILRQREENEQTIENFTQLCQELKYRGLEEVEELHFQISLLQQVIERHANQRAELEFLTEKQKRQIEELETAAKHALEIHHQSQIEIELPPIPPNHNSQSFTKEMAEQRHKELIELLELRTEYEQIKWKMSITQVDATNLALELQKTYQRHNDEIEMSRKQLRELEMDLQSERETTRRLKEDLLKKSHENQRKDNDEVMQLRTLISKLREEKELNIDALKDRQRESDFKVQELINQNSILEENLRQSQSQLKRAQNTMLENQEAQKGLVRFSADELSLLQSRLIQKETECSDLGRKIEALEGEIESQQRMQIRKEEGVENEKVKMLEQMVKKKESQILSLQVSHREMKERIDQNLHFTSTDESQRQHNFEDQILTLRNQLEIQEQTNQNLMQQIASLKLEVRKREELLDASDFFDNEDFDSSIEDDELENGDSDEIDLKLRSQIAQDAQGDSEEDFNPRESMILNETQKIQEIQKQIDCKLPESPSESKLSLRTKERTVDLVKDQIQQVQQNLKVQKRQQSKKRTVHQIQRDQLESLRSQLRQEIENRMWFEKKLRSRTRRLGLVRESLKDILNAVRRSSGKDKLMGREQSNSERGSQEASDLSGEEWRKESEGSDSEEEDATVEVMGLLKEQESRLQEAKGDMESVKLDLEIITREKELGDFLVNQLRSQLEQVQIAIQERQSSLSEFDRLNQELRDKLRIAQDKYQDLKDFYEREVIAEIKQSCDRRVQGIQSEMKRTKEEVGELVEKLSQARGERDQFERELFLVRKSLESEIAQLTRDLKHERSSIHQIKAEHDDRLRVLIEQRDNYKSLTKDLRDQLQMVEEESKKLLQEIENVREEKEELEVRVQEEESRNDQWEQQVRAGDERVQQNEEIIKYQEERLKENEEFIKQLEERLRENEEISEQMEERLKESEEIIVQLQERLKTREDQMFWSLVTEVNRLKKQETEWSEKLQFADKNSANLEEMRREYNQQIDEMEVKTEQEKKRREELEEECRSLVEQIGELRSSIQGLKEKGERKDQDNDIKALLNYQMAINDQLNSDNDQLNNTIQEYSQSLDQLKQTHQTELEALTQQIRLLQEDLDKKNEQLLEAQFKAEFSKAHSDFESDSGASEKEARMRKELEETRGLVKKLEQRQHQYEKGAEEMALKFKDKLKKQKDQMKQVQDENQTLREQLDGEERLRKEVETELVKLRQEEQSLIEHLEATGFFSFHQSPPDFSVLKHQIDLNQTQFDQLQEERRQTKEQLVDCLVGMGIEGMEEGDWKERPLSEILEKVEVVLQNYLEDQRQMRNLVDRNGQLSVRVQEVEMENQQLRDEKQQRDESKLAKKLLLMEEEQLELKSQLIIQIEEKDRQISRLESQLGVEPESRQEQQTKHQRSGTAGEKVNGGLFNSIASFFLTESDQRPQTGTRRTDQSAETLTEYEYYEYDDETEEDGGGFMKEELN